VKFKTKEMKMLEELVKKTSKEFIAGKLDVSIRTIERWLAGDSTPAYATRRYIAEIYNNFKVQEKKK